MRKFRENVVYIEETKLQIVKSNLILPIKRPVFISSQLLQKELLSLGFRHLFSNLQKVTLQSFLTLCAFIYVLANRI